jgi:dihydropyrimidinase
MLVIQGGMVVGADGGCRADVAVAGERIVAIGENLTGDQTIDAAGCYVIPGAIDPHVHLQMPLAGMVSTDDFRSGTRAAAFGGTTTVIDFVEPQPGQSMLEALAQRRAEADGQVAIDYGLHMTVPTWHGAAVERLAEFPRWSTPAAPLSRCTRLTPA